jgi:hypothetical protein
VQRLRSNLPGGGDPFPHPDVLKLMIGTRTIDEAQVRGVLTTAFETAFAKISATEKKLAG